MGQIFKSCAYDIENRVCCVYDADKFHANCYSNCGTVFSEHYLLRQKPYRVMWGGGYVPICDNLLNFTREEDLLGLSTYLNYDSFDRNNEDIESKSYIDQVRFIDRNSGTWEKIDVWGQAKKFFDCENTRSAKYSGYLLNHTKKLAIDLADYHNRSKYLMEDGTIATIDAIPVLTETGEGTPMAIFDGISIDSTENLAGMWCGDLLQIVDDLPEGYELIDCCFAEVWSRAKYCYLTYGLDENDLILSDGNGKLFENAGINMRGKRGSRRYNMKLIKGDDKVTYERVLIETATTE